jgi:hypothetical protein
LDSAVGKEETQHLTLMSHSGSLNITGSALSDREKGCFCCFRKFRGIGVIHFSKMPQIHSCGIQFLPTYVSPYFQQWFKSILMCLMSYYYTIIKNLLQTSIWYPFLWIHIQKCNFWIKWQFYFYFLRNICTVFHNGCTNL